MIRLLNISRYDKEISCTAMVEDCETPVSLVVRNNGEYDYGQLPPGYEYCTSHMGYARRFLKSLLGKDIVPSEKLIMWY